MNPVNESTKQKRASLGMKEPKAENQELAWKRVFDFFAKTLKTA